jgi:hypothetical protein
MRRNHRYAGLWGRLALLLIVPLAAWADLSGTVTVPAGSAVSLDTGIVSGSGGDILFSGGTLTAQGAAKAYDSGNVGLAGFNFYNLTILQSFGPLYSNRPLTPAAGDVIAVMTNGGNYAKALVTAVGASSIALQYLTYGATAAPPGPSITAVQNNYSYLQAGPCSLSRESILRIPERRWFNRAEGPESPPR